MTGPSLLGDEPDKLETHDLERRRNLALSSDDNEVATCGKNRFISAKYLAHPALDAVPYDAVSDLARGRDTQTRRPAIGSVEQEQHEVLSVKLLPPGLNRSKVIASEEPLGSRQRLESLAERSAHFL
jgi:hypothetical protein